jgi:mono/diheme cytochrome c family protein
MTLLPLLLAVALQVGSASARPTTLDTGRALYMAHCSRCHGTTAIGNGTEAASLRTRPTDLRRTDVLGSYSSDKLVERLREGNQRQLEFRPESIARQAADTEALYQFLRKMPSVSWRNVDRGREIYYRRCTPCHDRYGHAEVQLPQGVQARPRDLADASFQTGIGDRELRRLVRHGEHGMPVVVPRLTESEAAAVGRLVRLFSPGYELYDRYCSSCHGAHGTGGPGGIAGSPPAALRFDDRFFRQRDGEQVRQSIWHMIEDKTLAMPHFKDTLSVRDAEAILGYLRSLPALPAESSGERLE